MINFYQNNGKGFELAQTWTPKCWVCLECPSGEERKYLIDKLGVPEAFLNDIDDNDERPRREVEDDDWQMIVIRAPYRREDSLNDYSTVPLGFVFRGDVFVSVCNFKIDMLHDFVTYSVRKQITVANYYELIMRLMLSSSVWFLKYLKFINMQITALEAELQRFVRNDEIIQLQRLGNSLVYFETSLKGNDVLFYRMMHTKKINEVCDEELTEDVEIELKQAEETTSIYRNVARSMSSSYSSVISNNINATMKRLTSITLIIMFPTLIASLYGMNVPNYMENNNLAFVYIIGTSIVLSLVLFCILRKRNLF
ncbi:MAG: magnesium transporter CorA family protein [Salinivirgaceae bacterium]|nr:magnesium transporter CorA family protein [Salinivirgaceae bacterium]